MSQLIEASSPKPKTEAAILRASGIKRSFKMGDSTLVVLKHVDLTVRPGEFIAIEGRSGSGKSTLLHILGALDEADSGSVDYQGRNIAAMSGSARSALRNSQFGFVFQFCCIITYLLALIAACCCCYSYCRCN